MNKEVSKIIREFKKDKEISAFIKKHKLSDEDILNNFGTFFDIYNHHQLLKENMQKYIEEYGNNTVELDYTDGKISLVSAPLQGEGTGLLEFMYYDFELETGELYKNDARIMVLTKVAQFIQNYQEKKYTKGLYIHGSYGVGKTYIAMHLAQIISKTEKVLFVFFPDLVRNLKTSFQESNTESLILKIKQAPVLVLDDFGVSSLTPFVRDDALVAILQYRMTMNLPIIFTSNSSLSEIRKELVASSDIAGNRLYTRIKEMVDEVKLDDKNYRLR
ncbi:MAG TPA: ATP-binding protein [Bacilli bacterium]|nr:ATP-binding protein [Bacilli bacterium]HQB80321.1 ATP-binding protein [Bacilli bacterium]HQM17685.1 ATP-binding protein [Bacilli bacterium]